MSFHHIDHFNAWAVLVSGLLLWFLGAMWYSPALFAKPWMAAQGVTPSHVEDGLAAMISSLIGDVIAAFVMRHFVVWSGATTVGIGAFIGFLCWLGFFVAIQFPQALYEKRPMKVLAINAGYWLFGLMGTGALLAVWR